MVEAAAQAEQPPALEVSFGGGKGHYWATARPADTGKLDARLMTSSMRSNPWDAICDAVGAWCDWWLPRTQP